MKIYEFLEAQIEKWCQKIFSELFPLLASGSCLLDSSFLFMILRAFSDFKGTINLFY